MNRPEADRCSVFAYPEASNGHRIELVGDLGAILSLCNNLEGTKADQRSGRRCCSMKPDQVYCDVAVRRWEVATGRRANLTGGDQLSAFEGLAYTALGANGIRS
jgi:hypothetical protein